MAASKFKHIRGRLVSVTSQRQQYKPYGFELSFEFTSVEKEKSVFIEIDVPIDSMIEEDSNKIVLSLDGFNAILEATASSIDRLQQAYEKRVRNDDRHAGLV